MIIFDHAYCFGSRQSLFELTGIVITALTLRFAALLFNGIVLLGALGLSFSGSSYGVLNHYIVRPIYLLLLEACEI